jgi:hypothetical protein
MSAQPEFADHEARIEVTNLLREWAVTQAKWEALAEATADAEAQVLASLPGESWKPMEDRHTSQELARRVRLLERQVVDTERQRDDLQVRLSNAEIELGRLRARPRPWWRR